jgi:hypothetical protein
MEQLESWNIEKTDYSKGLYIALLMHCTVQECIGFLSDFLLIEKQSNEEEESRPADACIRIE